MKIKSFIGGFDKNISYLIWCESTRRAGIVDAAVDISEIIEFIESKNLISKYPVIYKVNNVITAMMKKSFATLKGFSFSK